MKVLLIVPSLRKTGPIEVVKSLILENNKHTGVEYSLISLRSGYPSQEKLFKKIVNLHVINTHSIFSIKQIKELRKLIKVIDPDIIHFNSFNSEIYLPWIHKGKIKFMTTIHMKGKEDFIFSYGKIIGYSMAVLQKLLYKRIDLFISVSDTVREHFQQLGFTPIKTIFNGVSAGCSEKLQKKSQNKSPIGIYVGNLDKRKNISLLLDVYSKLSFAKLVILGDDPQNSNTLINLKRKYENKNILFCGRVNNVYEYLNSADYFISASLSEGLPMAAIEAMSMNLDLILSDIPQHKELKKNPSQDIYFFNNNEKQLMNTIKKYFDTWQIKQVSNNRKYFLKYFTSYKMFENYKDTYFQLINNK